MEPQQPNDVNQQSSATPPPPVQPQSFVPPQAPVAPYAGMPAAAVVPQKTNVFAIVGLILAFFMPLIGLILSIVALSQIKKKQEGGRGLALAGAILSSIFVLVSIVWIALVIATFGGIQNTARDTEREVDIKAIHGQVEAYFASHGYYPTLQNLNDATWIGTNMPGLDVEALKDPQALGNTITDEPVLGKSYGYEPGPVGCNNLTSKCMKYTLGAYKEEANQLFVKENLN